jgi:hypothetical protein
MLSYLGNNAKSPYPPTPKMISLSHPKGGSVMFHPSPLLFFVNFKGFSKSRALFDSIGLLYKTSISLLIVFSI